jgi:hypothetical protein
VASTFFFLTLSWFIPTLNSLPTFSLVAFSLLISELAWPANLRWRKAINGFLPLAGVLVLASAFTVASVESGVIDLAKILFDPTIHPSALVLFTFISGMALGLVSGHFPTAFFALLPLLTQNSTPILRAAWVDGVLAGWLLCPFSLLNWIPSTLFHLPSTDTFRARFHQVRIPLVLGIAVYAISGLSSLTILRPVTFVFLCLVIVALHLKHKKWRLGNWTIQMPAS